MADKALTKKLMMVLAGLLMLALLVLFLAPFCQILRTGPEELDADAADFRLVQSLFPGAEMAMLQSYNLSGSWTGDSGKGFSARLRGLDDMQLSALPGMVRGDGLSLELESATEFVSDSLGAGELDWFPRYEDILSSSYFVYPLAMDSEGGYVDSARLLFMRPEDGMLFYAWVKI